MTKDINDFLGRMEMKLDIKTKHTTSSHDGKVANDHSDRDWFMDFIDSPDLR